MRAWVAAAFALAGSIGCSSHAANGDPDAPVAHVPDAAPDAPAPDADLNAATDVPAVPCADAMTSVYAATPQQGAPLGTILACAPDPTLDQAALPGMVGSGITVTSAVAQFRIAYQTRNGAGMPAVSTARVYLPSTPRARPVPIVVAAHGSVGLADSCTPSVDVDSSLPLPYAARGFAAIAPDLAGLGNAGTQDYLDNHAQGWQLLDGARALRALMAPGITAPELIVTGFSQGGGAALSAHSLIRGDGPGIGTLVATVAYAPEWPIRLASFNYIGILRDPTQLTIFTGLSNSSVAVMRQYAFLEDHVASGHGKDSVAASLRAGLETNIQSQCLVPFGGWVQTNMLHTGDLIDPTLRTGVLACVDALGPGAGCTGDAAAYYDFLLQNHLAADPDAGPVLLVQGLLDQIMPPANEGACIVDKLVGAGVDVDTCVIGDASHTNIMDHHAKGLAWAESVLAGGTRTECDPSNPLPACN